MILLSLINDTSTSDLILNILKFLILLLCTLSDSQDIEYQKKWDMIILVI